MGNDIDELMDFCDEKLKESRECIRRLEIDNNVLADIARMRGRENGFLICLVISMSIWIAAS